MKLKWTDAPDRTEWGAGMKEALVPIGKDSTLRLYAEAECVDAVHGAILALEKEATAWRLFSKRSGRTRSFRETPPTEEDIKLAELDGDQYEALCALRGERS